ncbi:MAG: M28 family peptidase [Gemmatimonadaceae bacterium]
MRRVPFFLTVPALSVALWACAGSGAPGSSSITKDSLSADVYAISADSMRGRLVGTREDSEAGDWIRARFQSLGLVPAGDDGFVQRFDMNWFSLGSGNSLTIAGAGGAREPGKGWTPASFAATASASGPVVYAGYGIVEPQLGWDDYKGQDVRGKVVLVLDGEPGANDPASQFDGLVASEGGRSWRKAVAAAKNGAAAILFVRRDTNATPDKWNALSAAAWPAQPRRIERFLLADGVNEITIPAAEISVELADALVKGSGRTLTELAKAAEDAPHGLGVVALKDARASLTTAVQRHVTPGRNILAMIQGSDSTLRNEVVIVSGHYDHEGADSVEIFHGADDNGSGAVGVMAVAQAYARAAKDGHRPRRTVLFAAWDAEERPELGSWFYTLHPRFPLKNTVAVLNMDMVGRNEEIPENGGARFRGLTPQTAESNANAMNIIGSSRSPDLAADIKAADKPFGLTIRFRYDNNESNLLRRSDQWPFLNNGVPAVWFFTGLHPDYHRPSDVANKINYEKMTRVVKLLHAVSWDLANANGRPAIEPMGSRPRM